MIFANVFEGIALDLEGFDFFINICFISVAASIKVKCKISENQKSMVETCYFKGVFIKIFFEKRFLCPLVLEDVFFYKIKTLISF